MEINLNDGRKVTVTGAGAKYNLANKAARDEGREEAYSFSGGEEPNWLATVPPHNRRAYAELLALDELNRNLDAQRGMDPSAAVSPPPKMTDYMQHLDRLLPGPERALRRFQGK